MSETETTGVETPGGESTPPSKRGGFSSFLPLLVAIIAMPGVAIGTLKVKDMFEKKSSGGASQHAEEKSETAEKAPAADHGGGSAHDSSAKGKSAKSSEKRNINLSVPLTRQLVKYVAAAKAGDVEKIVTLDVKGEMKDIAESDKVVVNIANTGGGRYAVARFSMIGDSADLIDRVNEFRIKLIASVRGALESETLEDFQRPGFRNLLASALVAQFNSILGPGTVKEIIIEELVIQ
jgi:hypothetical protein